MRFLRQNTAIILTVGPFYDRTDGVTIETALTITNERITLTADTDAGSAPTNVLDNVTGATSGTSNDLNYITGNDAGMMQLELAAADTNRVGRMMLSITDAANHVPVFHEFFVLPQAIYDWLTGVIVPLPANVTQFGGTNLTSASGIPEVKVNNIAANAITATSINADAITDAKVASDVTIASVTGAVGSVTGAVGSVTGAVGSIASGGITAASIASDAITAAKIAADAITAAKLAADVTTEVQSGLSTLTQANVRTAVGLASANLDTQLDALPTNAELTTALGTADDATLAAVAALNNLSSAQAQTAATAALNAYDPPTRTEATSDKAEIITEVNANETKIDTLDTVADAIKLQTDKLTFTVANQLDSNVQSVNDVTVTGTGASGDEWGA